MKLLTVQPINFQSIGECRPLPLDGQGLVLIEGNNKDDRTAESNGAGKSTIFDAITWALFGETVRGMSGDEIVNERLPKDCSVTLTIEDDKGNPYTIVRYRKHHEHKNKLRLLAEGKRDLSTIDPGATQEKIEALVGMDFDTFMNAALFGQGVVRHFPAMTDKEQKEIMEKLVGVEVLRKAHAEATVDLTRIAEEIEALEEKFDPSTLATSKEELKDLEDERRQFSAQQAKRAEAAAAALAKERQSGGEPKKAAKVLAEASAAHVKATAASKAADTEAREANNARASAEIKAQEARTMVFALLKSLKRMDNLQPGVVCEHCGSEITEDTVNQHTATLKADRAKHEKIAAKLEAEVVEARKVVEVAEERADKEGVTERKVYAAWVTAKRDLAVAEEGKERIIAREAELARVLNEKWTGFTRLEKLTEKIKNREAGAKAAAKRIEVLKTDAEHQKFVVTMFSDKGVEGAPPLKGLIFESVTPFLNKHAAHYSKYLSSGNLLVQFSAQSALKSGAVRDRFEVVAVNRHGSSSYGGQSGGEKRKVDICAALALQRLGAARARAQLNIAFYDEVFESLDETACDAVMELLQAEAKNYSSLFVITHQVGLQSYFPKTWLVTKERGIARVTV
jgi:DNA repair exonuclease SbcCD ATPase subunit